MYVILKDKKLANVSKIIIVNALNKLGYTYKDSRLKMKNVQLQRDTRYNWCLKNINTNIFYGVFFSDQCIFYLNNPCGSRWLKIVKIELIFRSTKEEK